MTFTIIVSWEELSSGRDSGWFLCMKELSIPEVQSARNTIRKKTLRYERFNFLSYEKISSLFKRQ